MSLIDKAMTECVMLDRITAPDGEGGIVTTWNEGAPFRAAVVFDNSISARTAERQGVTSVYTITVGKNVPLMYHDVFRRLSDRKVFRVTSDGDDKLSPDMSSIAVKQVSAEEWEIK